MWCELRFAIYTRKVPIYGPYLFLLISKTWEKLYPEEEFEADCFRHDPIHLCVKTRWANTTTRAQDAAAQMGTDEEPVEEPADVRSGRFAPSSSSAVEEPSWAKKLKQKMKALFCMQAKGQYRAHVTDKKTRQRDKKILSLYGEEVSNGSEDNITPEATWMARQGYQWTDSDDGFQPEQQGSDEDYQDEEQQGF